MLLAGSAVRHRVSLTVYNGAKSNRGKGSTLMLTFQPKPGTLLVCDFGTGFKMPEMVKKRPVVVISPRRRRSRLCTVVPLSTTAPNPVERFHHLMNPQSLPVSRFFSWTDHVGEVRHAVHRGSGSTGPGETQNRRPTHLSGAAGACCRP